MKDASAVSETMDMNAVFTRMMDREHYLSFARHSLQK